MPRKMLPALPDSGGSENERFVRFAKAILAVPKAEITPTTDESLKKLEAIKLKLEGQLAKIRVELAKRNTEG
jgi:hypothetical protein